MSKGDIVLPRKLYRFFKVRKHAESFLSGNIRFGTLQKYREEEDLARGDKTEGNGNLMVPGEVLIVNLAQGLIHVAPGLENLTVDADPRDHFVCCLAACEEPELAIFAKEFGPYCVSIHSPERFIEDLSHALAVDITLCVNPPALEWGAVRYDKYATLTEPLSREEKLRLAWIQKPSHYSNQKEFRVQFNFTPHELIGSREHHSISIGRPLSYCELLHITKGE